MKLSNDARTALKNAISSHPAWNTYRRDVLGGMNTGNMTKQQLFDAAAQFGIDIHALAAAADTAAASAAAFPMATAAAAIAAQNTHDAVMAETGDKEAAKAAAEKAAAEAFVAADTTKDEPLHDDETSETPILDKAIADAKSVLDHVSPFLGDKLRQPLENAIAHLALAAKDEVANVVPLVPVAPGSLPQAKPVSQETAGKLFDVKSPTLKSRKIRVWDAKDAPRSDKDFAFVDDLLEDMLVAFERCDTVWLAGPKGTGKTSLPREIAARTKRPCVRIAHHRTTEPVELIGSMYPSENGGVEWKDGVLTAAIRRAGTIIILDEPTFCRAGVLALYQTLLDHRFLTLAENGGEVVPVAQGVVFVIADNTAGNGDNTGRYADTNSMNAAFLDRAAKILKVDYLPRAKEIEVLQAKTGCNVEAAETIVDFAAKTRKAGEQGDITEGLSFRRMVALANDIQDGIAARRAFQNCVLNHAPADDAVSLNELAKAHLDFKKLDGGKPQPSNSKAASQFDPVSL